jgi:O-antigen/teichoic acid export membrane protein
VFWALAAHLFTSDAIGIAGAVISLCSMAALLTYLGSSAFLIERLPASEYSTRWTTLLVRVCAVTAVITALVTIAAVPVVVASPDYAAFFSTAMPTVVAVIGAAAWTLVNLLGAAFVAARRAGRLLTTQTLVSVAKVVFVVPLAAAGLGAAGLVDAWAASALLGVGAAVAWLIPRMRLGRRPGHVPRRAAADAQILRRPRQGPAQHRRATSAPSAGTVRHVLAQHLTSVGGAVTPLVLPVLVVIRLGATLNAYFYITWMLGLAFFMVSPSVATAVFAEGVRTNSDLRTVVVKALRVIILMLVPPVAIMIIGGRLILGLFGPSYASAGYGLLVLLAISALPDAVSNVAVAVFRITQRLGYSTAVNLGILTTTLVAAWILMPRMGIEGVGVAWLGVQTIGAIACLPAYAKNRAPIGAKALIPSPRVHPGQSLPEPGIALLIDLAKQQSLDRVNGWLG